MPIASSLQLNRDTLPSPIPPNPAGTVDAPTAPLFHTERREAVSKGSVFQRRRNPEPLRESQTMSPVRSWVKTPAEIRKLGGALYCDRRYGRVFVGHNGAQSYYSARAFRGSLRV